MNQIIAKLFIGILFIQLFILIDCECPFPKKIWMYWSESQQYLPIAPKFCYNQIKQQAQKYNFEVILLHENNLHQYITEIQEFRTIVSKSINNYRANYADFIRLTVLEQHGGVWIDITTILTQDLHWLDNLENQKQFIVNKNGENIHDPQVLLFYNPIYGHRQDLKDQNDNLVNELPGYQSWFIGAKKAAPLIVEWRKKFIQYYLKQYIQIIEDLSNNQIFLPHFGQSEYYRVFYSIYYVIQKKQRQLDKLLTLFDTERYNANVYYRIWGLNCHLGPCQAYMGFLSVWIQMSRFTQQEIYMKNKPIRYFAKLIHHTSGYLNTVIQEQIRLYQQNITLKEAYERQPWFDSCVQINFIVQNSIVSKLIQANPNQKVKVQSVSQRDQWIKYCQNLQKFDKIIENIKSYFLKGIEMLIWLIVAWRLSKLQHFNNDNKHSNKLTSSYSHQNSLDQTRLFYKKIIIHQLSVILLVICNFLIIKYGIELDYENRKNQFMKSFIIVTITLIIDFIVIRGQKYQDYYTIIIKSTGKLSIIYIQLLNTITKINNLLRIVCYFSVAKICLNVVQNRPQNMTMYSIIFGLIGPIVFQIGCKLQKASNNQNSKRILNYIGYIIRISIIVFLAIICLFPHFVYLIKQTNNVSIGQVYLIRGIIQIKLWLFIIVGIYIAIKFEIERSKLSYKFKKYFKKIMVFVLLSLNSCVFYITLYYHRLTKQEIKFNLQLCYCFVLMIVYNSCIFKKTVDQKKLSEIRISFKRNKIKILCLQQFSLSFLIAINLLTPYQYYVNQYQLTNDLINILIEMLTQIYSILFRKFTYIYLGYQLIGLLRNSYKSIKYLQNFY